MPSVPPPRQNLASLVRDFEKHNPEIAVVDRSGLRITTHTYGELARLSGRFAALLSQKEIGKGDRVLIWAPNSAHWMAAFFGCVLRGVLPVPLDDAGSVAFAESVIEDVKPKLIVASAAHARELSAQTERLQIEQLAEVLPAQADTQPVELAPSDPLQIVFTSGTTGEPKGIVHTHGNVLASLRPIETEIGKYLKYERPFHPLRFLHTLPLSHVFGQFMGMWIPPLLAAEVHFEERLIASDLVLRVKRERISVIAAVPRVLDLMREFVRHRFPDIEERRKAAQGARAWKRWWVFRDVHRLLGFKFWALVCGGAALPADLEEFWLSLGFVVVQGYGMTETTALVSLNHPFRASRGSLGQILPGREVKLSPEGEVLVRGDTVSQSVWQGGRVQQREHGWLATGDLAELDEAGNLRFRGRKKDVIVTSAGLNIYPDDLEAALMRVPEVKACAVIETQGRHGPEPLAALVLRGGSPEQAVATANKSLADYQRIRRWTVWPEPDLPRTSTGKVLRREVARVLDTGSDAGAASGSVTALIDRLTRAGDGPGAALANGQLDLDSLARVELQANLEEHFGVTIDDSVMQSVRTVDDLKSVIEQPRSQQIATRGTSAAELEADEHIYPQWPLTGIQRFLRCVFLDVVMRGFLYVLGKPRVYRQTPPLPRGPLLLYANHVTAVDAAFVLYALPASIRHRTAIAMSGEILMAWRKRRYYRYRILNWISPLEYLIVTALFNVFPLPQKSGFRQSFTHAARTMDRGYSILVFPEGTRAEDETLGRFMSGSGLLWSELRCPALPVFLGGLGELKRTRENWFRSRKLYVRLGQPIPPRPDLTPDRATRVLEAELRKLGDSKP